MKAQTEEKQISQHLVLKHGQKRVIVKRQRSYNLVLDSACKHFPSISRDEVTFQTNQLDVCDGHYVDITAEIWDDAVDLLNIVEVTRRAESISSVPLPNISLPNNQPGPSQFNEQYSSNDGNVTIKLVFPSGEIQTAKISRWPNLLLMLIKYWDNVPLLSGQFWLGCLMGLCGVIMHANRRIRSYTMEDCDCFPVYEDGPFVRKPVIYLYSPSEIDVSVTLSLIPEWSLSVIYPVVAIEDHGQRLEWNVRTHQDGSLTEHYSGLDVSYLFWEAELNLQAFPQSSASKPQLVDTFNPISSTLYDTDSIVIPADKVTVYLDKSLKVLGLHTEARTSFITYWLPYILKHEYIALRFVRQAAYERTASLHISPQPDVVTRVCMLFKGIRQEHLANWANAQMRAEKDVDWWVDVVGVDPARASDVTLFRVLEWGGMEVPI
ncbi:uncharacterized protein EDB93DRAFT_254693 [Suillus bovinus]|uniref:uncharacterized protein n=1 Tax=Suillus bovinus TaxID=48563 RepID=UPI001B8769D9|nr:uncharacterized protein EDB93DRAFT_254693 [Suillus bovinus]KAG2152605.1 hypothetical protein EDB93DRAFT_254693 [Suillus bovinus]